MALTRVWSPPTFLPDFWKTKTSWDCRKCRTFLSQFCAAPTTSALPYLLGICPARPARWWFYVHIQVKQRSWVRAYLVQYIDGRRDAPVNPILREILSYCPCTLSHLIDLRVRHITITPIITSATKISGAPSYGQDWNYLRTLCWWICQFRHPNVFSVVSYLQRQFIQLGDHERGLNIGLPTVTVPGSPCFAPTPSYKYDTQCKTQFVVQPAEIFHISVMNTTFLLLVRYHLLVHCSLFSSDKWSKRLRSRHPSSSYPLQ